MCVTCGNKEKAIVADDALSRARKALAAPNSGAVVPANNRSGRDLIAAAKAAAAKTMTAVPVVRAAPNDQGSALVARIKEAAAPRPVSIQPKAVVEAPVAARAPADETKGALVARVREAAARPLPIRPVAKAPEPAPIIEPPVEAPAAVPATVPAAQIVPVEVAPGQTMPVQIPPNAAAGGGQPIVFNVTVVNEQRGWGPYWPYWHGCGRFNCPHLRGLPCNRFWCW
jgi:hypothetical protein